MAEDNGIQFLLYLAQQERRIDSRKVPVDMLVDDFHERQKLSNRKIRLHCKKPGDSVLRYYRF